MSYQNKNLWRGAKRAAIFDGKGIRLTRSAMTSMNFEGLDQTPVTNFMTASNYHWLVFAVHDFLVTNFLGAIGNANSSGIISCWLVVNPGGQLFLIGTGFNHFIGTIQLGQTNTLSVQMVQGVGFRVILNNGAEQSFSGGTFPLTYRFGNYGRDNEPDCEATFYEYAVFPATANPAARHAKLTNGGKGGNLRWMQENNACVFHVRFDPAHYNPATSTFTPLRIPPGVAPMSLTVYNGYALAGNSVQFTRRFGTAVNLADPVFTAIGIPTVVLDATFTAPAGTSMNAYVPETGPQFTQASNWITGTTPPWAFDGAGRVSSSTNLYAFAAAPLNQSGSVRGVMEGMVYPIAGGKGFVLLSNAAGTDMIRCQLNRNGAAGNLTLYIIFDRAGQAGVPHLLDFTAADGGQLTADTDGTSVTVKYVQSGITRAELTRTAPSPYTGGFVGIFTGESNQNTIDRFTVTRFT